MHRAHAAAIDERAHAERAVGVGVHLHLPDGGCGIIAGDPLMSRPDARPLEVMQQMRFS
jgi:hypothetical protein